MIIIMAILIVTPSSGSRRAGHGGAPGASGPSVGYLN